ncbi:MAG: hypothetical protein ABIK79_11180 [Chloroflexota bacterium]
MKRSDGITVLSVYHFLVAALSVLGVCASLGVLLIFIFSQEWYQADAYVVLGLAAVLSFIVMIAHAAAGWALFKMLEWGRWLSIALGVLSLLLFPVGTIIGGVTIWYLLQPAVRDSFLAPGIAEEE